MIGDEKEVYYNLYCGTCVYVGAVDKDGFPVQKCEECQSTPMNVDTHKPINYKENSK